MTGVLEDGRRAVVVVEEDESIQILSALVCWTVRGGQQYCEIASGTTDTQYPALIPDRWRGTATSQHRTATCCGWRISLADVLSGLIIMASG